MNKTIKNARKAGASPGTLIHIGENYDEEIKITLIEYNEDSYEKKDLKGEELSSLNFSEERSTDGLVWNNSEKLSMADKASNPAKVKWLNVDGLSKIGIIESIGALFKFHPLVLEDILNTGQRTKIEDYNDYVYIVLKKIIFDEKSNELKSQQISVILINNCIVTFQETEENFFDSIKNRIKAGKGNIRKFGADYLLYALIDTIVDSYFVILEKMGNKIDEAEEDLLEDPGKEIFQKIHKLKREMLFLRKSLWPFREVISFLLQSENVFIDPHIIIYLRDVYDHIIQVIDTIEVYRDMLSGMLDTYLSSIGNKTNEVMKVLTILSTIFIPITFLAGVYGMNFEILPELKWRWSYAVFWLICILSTILMLRFFKKKKWL